MEPPRRIYIIVCEKNLNHVFFKPLIYLEQHVVSVENLIVAQVAKNWLHNVINGMYSLFYYYCYY